MSVTLPDVVRDGGAIGWLQLVAAVAALGLTIDGAIRVRRRRLCPRELLEEVEALFEAGDYQEAAELCEAQPNFFTDLVATGLANSGRGFGAIERSLAEATAAAAAKLRTRMASIAVLGMAALLLGLLGTLRSSAGLPTAVGLGIAIPAAIAFVLLRRRLSATTSAVGGLVAELFERFRARATP